MSGPQLPADAKPLTSDDCAELGALRHLSPFAPGSASHLGTLFIGTVGGYRCWIITDERRICAEARRMDGEEFPAIGSLGERKAHTLKGSVKNWPVGLAPRHLSIDNFRAILAVEGGPDYLAAVHFSTLGSGDCLPIAFLGAATAGTLHPEVPDLLRGRRIRFYPHADENQAGTRAVERWCWQLAGLGCAVDAFRFQGLQRADGRPVKDLNDCTQIAPEQAQQLEELLP